MQSRPDQPTRRIATINPADAVRQVASGALTLIDIRDISELRITGHASGAIHIPLTKFRMQADPSSPEFHHALSPDKPVALYCASGARSQMAAELMLQMGFTTVYNLGGLHHWQMAGGTVTR